MANIGLFYGSNGGATEDVAQRIASKLGNVDVVAISESTVSKIGDYEQVILGTSTYGDGDLQDDWDDVLSRLDDIDFSNRTVALFGLGDQDGFPDTFLDGMGILNEKLTERGARFVGRWDSDGYDFMQSKAIADGGFAGLAIDEDNQSELTDKRIAKWVDQLKTEFQKGA
jgi:flavodoxin I